MAIKKTTINMQLLLACCIIAILASLLIGSQIISPTLAIKSLKSPETFPLEYNIVWDLRLTRTIIGILSGLAFAIAGTIIQGITRNPLADTGLLGINSGASLGVLSAIILLDIQSRVAWTYFAFIGATLAALIIYSISGKQTSPEKIVVVGVAISAALTSICTFLLLSDLQNFKTFRFWMVGSLAGQDIYNIKNVVPFIIIGIILALFSAKNLNLTALGDNTAKSLGQNLVTINIIASIAIILLASSATALSGPIVFVGLASTHIARKITKNNYINITICSALIGIFLVLSADIIGRIIASPGEIEAGIIVAFIGTPILIFLLQKDRLPKI